MSRVSPNPECLPDTMIQTRAKKARIQSQRPLSHESTIEPPTLLNKPLGVGVPTSSGFKLIITDLGTFANSQTFSLFSIVSVSI